MFDELQSHRLIEATPEGKAIWTALVAQGNWQQTFTFLRLQPALIWGSEDRPKAFSGTVSIAVDDHPTDAPVSTSRRSRRLSSTDRRHEHFRHMEIPDQSQTFRRLTDYLAIALVQETEAVTMTEELALMTVKRLDLDHIRLAARINISEWQNNRQSKQYISYLNSKQGRKLSDYFRDFIGCQEGIDAPSETRTLLKAFSDFVESEDI